MKLLIVFKITTLTFALNLPPEIEICSISDPNYKKCLISSAEKSLTVFAKGYEDLEFPPLEPVHLNQIVIEPQPGLFNVHQKYTNISLEGCSKAKITDIGIDLDHCTIWLNNTAKSLKATSNYEIKGQLLLLPIDAKGGATLQFGELKTHIRATCEKFKKHEKEYLRVLNVTLSSAATQPKFDFDVLISGNSQLDRDIHKVIDDNPAEFFELMRPTCETMFGVVMLKIFNAVFTKIPLQELFRD